MNYILFIKIVAWFGAIGYTIGFIGSVCLYSYYELTNKGKQELLRSGTKILSYRILRRLTGVVVCVAALIALYY